MNLELHEVKAEAEAPCVHCCILYVSGLSL